MAVQQPVVGLVAVAHQAVVTGRLAVFIGAGRSAAVLARVRVEVAQGQRLTRHLGQRSGIVHELAQHTRAALGGLIKQDLPPVLPVGQRLGRELAVF